MVRSSHQSSSRPLGRLHSLRSVRIRPLHRADVLALRDGFASGLAGETTRWTFPRSLPSMLGYFDGSLKVKDRDSFAIRVEGEFAGICSLRPSQFSGRELTIVIFEPRFRGRGVGTAAVRKLCAFGFEKLKLQRIELGVYPTNHVAIQCYVRCGFQYEALLRKYIYHDGKWVDIMWMSLLHHDFIT
jgi:RimJ/RimL family protein N-acetyltransferase